MPSGLRPRVVGGASSAVAFLLVLGGIAIVVVILGLGGGGDNRGRVTHDRMPVLYVGKAGCDDSRAPSAVLDPSTPWCSLDRALAAAPSGSKVVVGPGRYPKLEADGAEGPVRQVAFAAQFSDDRRPRLAGVGLNRVSGIGFTGFWFTKSAEFFNATDMTLSGNRFTGAAIGIKSSRRVTVEGNTVRRLRGASRAFLALGSPDGSAPIEDLVVRGNRFEHIDHDAIAVYNTNRRVLIEGNQIAHVRQPRGFPYHSDGIQLMGGTDVTVRDNVITDVTQAMLIKDGHPARRLRVEGNLVTKVAGAGLQIFNAPGAVVDHNTVWNSRFGVILDNDTTMRGRTRVVLESNVFDSLLVRQGAKVKRARNNVFRRGPAVGSDAQQGTPRFVNAGRGDYRIRGAGDPPGAQKRVR